jgi:DNA polymerase-1
VSFDYSQQELRILAHLSREEKLIEAFKQKRDIHATTASQIFRCDYDAVTKEQRTIAKTINFGIIYGMGSYGMSMSLGIPVEEAQKFITSFYTTYPNIRSYFDTYLKNGKVNRYVETLLGRRRYVFEFPKQTFIDNAMRRVLINFPIQGSAADLMRKTMVEVHEEIIKKDYSCKLLLQIHDDLVFEMDDDPEKMKVLITIIREKMCNVFPLLVPIEVEVKIGKSWGAMRKME